mgnify:CR=1 FL=1
MLNTDALLLPETLREMGHPHCDYIVSGLPFFVIEPKTKDKLSAEHREGNGQRQPLHHLPDHDTTLRSRSSLRARRQGILSAELPADQRMLEFRKASAS